MRHDDTGIGGPQGEFPSTRISLIEAASGSVPNEALNGVIALYWKPVYRFLRLKFHKDNEEAKDLTQGFFTTVIERDFLARFDPSKASFRTYVRMAVERFAANRHAAEHRLKRGGQVRFETLDDGDTAGKSPEEAFESEWRRQLFALALEDFETFAARTGKARQFAIFQGYDLADGDRPTYAVLAERHGIAESSVTNHLAWARRTLRDFVNARLRGVTGGERELRQEMRRLWT